jgi:MFS family permease
MRTKPNPALVETSIPARLDRPRWGQFHTLVVVALGITWILDGLEVTLAGAVAGALKESPTLNLTNAEVGLASSFYLTGAVLGAPLFGWLTDRLGRKRLFFITLTVYLVATAATAFSLEFHELRPIPLSHRGWHWRRVYGHCLDHPGVCAGALSRLD